MLEKVKFPKKLHYIYFKLHFSEDKATKPTFDIRDGFAGGIDGNQLPYNLTITLIPCQPLLTVKEVLHNVLRPTTLRGLEDEVRIRLEKDSRIE